MTCSCGLLEKEPKEPHGSGSVGQVTSAKPYLFGNLMIQDVTEEPRVTLDGMSSCACQREHARPKYAAKGRL